MPVRAVRKRGKGKQGAPAAPSAFAADAATIPPPEGEDLLQITQLVSVWFSKNARELPWREVSRDGYRALVSEAMLQQTQVSRVIEKYSVFLELFPTVRDLASASEQEVLAAWTGLGYYRRARHLHGAAKKIVAEFGGIVPRRMEELRSLPGVGRYTAGAVASMVYGERAAIVDGNVARVVLRVHGKDAASDDKQVQAWLWARALELVNAAESPAVFNEGLMELGATVCVPAPGAPACGRCPLREVCVAHREGREMEIPRPKARAERKQMHCGVVVVERADGRVLVEQRQATGMWAGMWQAVTVERADRAPTGAEMACAVGVKAADLERAETFEFLATHRKMAFEVWRVRVSRGFAAKRGEFVARKDVGGLGMSSPQRRVLLG